MSLLASGLPPAIEQVWDRPWPWSIWLTILVILVVGALITALYFTERGKAPKLVRGLLVALRLSVLLIVWWMLAGWNVQRFKSDLPELVILIDESASMQTVDLRSGETGKSDPRSTRWQVATRLLSQVWEADSYALSRRYRSKLVAVANEARSLAIEPSGLERSLAALSPSGDQSRLGDGLIQVLQRQSGRPTAALVLLSDGIVTSGAPLDEVAIAARRLAVPILCVATGEQLPQPDLALVDLLADDAVYLGDRVNVQVSIAASDIAAHRATLNLRDMQSGQIVDSTQVDLSTSPNTSNVQLSFVPKTAGNSLIKLEITPAPNEKNLDNNQLQRVIEVRDQTLRILMVQKSPGFEFRFLKTLLERTSQIGDSARRAFDLDVVLQDADATHVGQDAHSLRLVPGDQATIASYDVIVLGELDPSLIASSTQQLIVEQVKSAGCGCIFICQPGFKPSQLSGWPLAALLPLEINKASDDTWYFEDEPSRWRPTSLGQSALPLQLTDSIGASELWRTLPGPHWFYHCSGLNSTGIPSPGSKASCLKPSAQVLAMAVVPATPVDLEAPLLISQFSGSGRVVLQTTDETYRWIGYRGSDQTYQRYWIQMLRWLSRGKLNRQNQTELTIEPRQAKLGQPVQFSVRLSPEDAATLAANPCSVTVQRIGGDSKTIALQRTQSATATYKTNDSSLPSGSYRASISQPADTAAVSATFSITTPPGEQANLRSDWTAMRDLADQTHGKFLTVREAENLLAYLPKGSPVRRGPLPPIPLWNSAWIAAVLLSLLTLEWIIRRSNNML